MGADTAIAAAVSSGITLGSSLVQEFYPLFALVVGAMLVAWLVSIWRSQ